MPRIQHKRGTSANLASVNPTPLAGELVWDSTENAIKIGDGATAWSSLAYVTATPRSHKSTHATGGSDALTPADIGAAPAASPTFTNQATIEGSIRGILNLKGNFAGATDHAGILAKNAAINIGNIYWSGTDDSATASGAMIVRCAASGTLTERMRVTSTGNVGIGTPSPSSLLHVNGVITVSAGTAAAPALVASGDANTGAFFPAADTFAISTAGSERVRVDAAGRLRIGAEAGATHLLEVQGQNATTLASQITVSSGVGGVTQQFRNESATDGAYVATQFWVRNSNGSNQLAAFGCVSNPQATTARSPDFVWTTRSGGSVSTERMRLRHNGNLGLATGDPTALLDINADKIRLRTAKTPASASDTGNAGDICWDASYLYICTATNTWRRIAHSTW